MRAEKLQLIWDETNRLKTAVCLNYFNANTPNVDKQDLKDYFSSPYRIVSFLCAFQNSRTRNAYAVKIGNLFNEYHQNVECRKLYEQANNLFSIISMRGNISCIYNQEFEDKVAYHYIQMNETEQMKKCVKFEQAIVNDYFQNQSNPHITNLAKLVSCMQSSEISVPFEIWCMIGFHTIKDDYKVEISNKIANIINHTWSYLFKLPEPTTTLIAYA